MIFNYLLTLFISSLALLATSNKLYAQQHIPLTMRDAKAQKLWIEQANNGYSVVGYWSILPTSNNQLYNSKETSQLLFQVIDSTSISPTTLTLPVSHQLIGATRGDNTVAFYTAEEKKGVSFKRIVFTQGETPQTFDLLHLPEEEAVVSITTIEETPAIISVNKENELSIYSLSDGADLLCRLTLQNKDIATLLRKKGALAITNTYQLPTLFQTKELLQLFYQKGLMYLVLDDPKNEKTLTHIEIIDIQNQTSSVKDFKDASEEYIESDSYIAGDYLYRLLRKGKSALIQSYLLEDQQLIGSYDLKNLYTSSKLPYATSKNYHKQQAGRRLLENYKKEGKFIGLGQAGLIILPLSGNKLQINTGIYYENNAGINPGLGVLGALIYVASTTARSLHESGKGVETYLSLNFDDPKLEKLSDLSEKSILNLVDQMYIELLAKHKKLHYFDYQLIGGIPTVVYATHADKKVTLQYLAGYSNKKY